MGWGSVLTGAYSLGISQRNKERVKRIDKRYYWDKDTFMLFKRGGTEYGDLIVLAPGERRKIVEEIHKYGHAGVNKVHAAVVENFFWPKMQKDVRKMIKACHCGANKQKITVVAPLKPTPVPLEPFDLVAIALMSLTKSYQGN